MAHETSEITGFAMDSTPGGSLVNLSGDINTVTVSGGKELLDDTGLGDTRRTRVPGLAGPTSVSINGWHNSTTRAIFTPDFFDSDTSRTIEVKYASGDFHSGEAYPENGTPFSSNVAAVNTFNITFTAENGLTGTSVTGVA